VIVVIADGCRQDLFGVVLLDDKAIQILLYVPGKVIEMEIQRLFLGFISLVRCASLIGLSGEHAKPDAVTVSFREELLHVLT